MHDVVPLKEGSKSARPHSFYTEENIQYLLSLRKFPLFFYHCTYHCDVLTDFDHGIKIRTVEGL
jgi:hypothetical protein